MHTLSPRDWAMTANGLWKASLMPASGRRRRRALVLRLEHEDLEGPHGIEHDLAVIRDHATADDLGHSAHHDVAHHLLEGEAVLPHVVHLARGEHRLLVARQPALERHEDVVVEDPGLRRCRAAAVEL